VTIHYVDHGIDTGDIIVQKEVAFQPEETLKSSYRKLSVALEQLFMQTWPDIRAGNLKAKPQPAGGSFHRLKDRLAIEHLLYKGWDTPVAALIGKASKNYVPEAL
jgi:methionyl-tRNA formyltransferase